MAAGEDELESLVLDRRVVHLVLNRFGHLEQTGLRGEGAIAADAVDRAVARGRDKPGARIGGRPLVGPALGRDRERLLSGLLGEVEVAEETDQVGEDASPLVAEDLVEDRYHSAIGRTSTAPPMRAAGMRAASSIAASMSSASNTRYPPSASLTATNGPSVVSVLPSSTRTVVAVWGSSSWRPGLTPGVSLTAL